MPCGNSPPSTLRDGKREAIIERTKLKLEYLDYKAARLEDETLPGTPRIDMPKRSWERHMRAWKDAMRVAWQGRN